tara:strand:+ start:1744 stop:1899 length:156 start_codon:yes stop_codon:yes gene_type:complete
METTRQLENCKRLIRGIEYLRGQEGMDPIINQVKKVLHNKLNKINETIRDI